MAAWLREHPESEIVSRECAKAILSKPLTDEAKEQMQAEIDDPDDLEVPLCPACGASDPLLTSVDPVNTWRCEEWSTLE